MSDSLGHGELGKVEQASVGLGEWILVSWRGLYTSR